MTTITAGYRPPDWGLAGIADVLEAASTEAGDRLVDLVDASSVLLVFLRHSGCTFCREAVSDIAKAREEIENTGTRIVLVHMKDRDGMESLVQRHRLCGIDRICDSEQKLYRAFGLKKGTWRQLMGFKVWVRGLLAGIGKGHGFAFPKADSTQMPGVFLVSQGLVAKVYRHLSAADRPRYTSLCSDGSRLGTQDREGRRHE